MSASTAGRRAAAVAVPVAGLLAAARQLLVGFERGITSERQGAVRSALQGRVAKRFGAIRSGCLVLVRPRSGNDSENIEKNPIYPASYGDSNILAVAASTSSDTLASFSNFGSQSVDLAAPGDRIFSTYLGGGCNVLSGTSMAAPYVAGVAAMLRKQESGATYGELRKAVRSKVDKPPAFANKVVSDGRLNADRALGDIGSIVD